MQMTHVAIRPAYPNPQTNPNHQATVNQTNVCSWLAFELRKQALIWVSGIIVY